MPPSKGKQAINPSEKVDLSTLFMRRYNHAGRDISRPIWFYISLNKNGYAATRRLIIDHGGKVGAHLGDKHTSKEICLIDPHAKASRDGRPAYSVDYIQSCISAQCLLNIEDFRIPPVGRSRRTLSPQNAPRSVQDQPNENGRRQPEIHRMQKVTETKDSEVTDDLPCIAGSAYEAQEPATANDQMKVVLPPEGAPLDNTKAGIVDTEMVRKDGTNDGTKDGRKHPHQSVAPLQDSMNWSKEEDNAITQLCVDAKEAYHATNRDPNKVFTLGCWFALETAQLLPEGRSAKACFARAKHLWKNGDTENGEGAELDEESGVCTKRAPLLAPQTRDPEREDELKGNGNQHRPHRSPQGSPERRETEQRPETLRNATRRETREYIFELVNRIAKRGKVTKRNAFRALREERGHWKRALRRVSRRK